MKFDQPSFKPPEKPKQTKKPAERATSAKGLLARGALLAGLAGAAGYQAWEAMHDPVSTNPGIGRVAKDVAPRHGGENDRSDRAPRVAPVPHVAESPTQTVPSLTTAQQERVTNGPITQRDAILMTGSTELENMFLPGDDGSRPEIEGYLEDPSGFWSGLNDRLEEQLRLKNIDLEQVEEATTILQQSRDAARARIDVMADAAWQQGDVTRAVRLHELTGSPEATRLALRQGGPSAVMASFNRMIEANHRLEIDRHFTQLEQDGTLRVLLNGVSSSDREQLGRWVQEQLSGEEEVDLSSATEGMTDEQIVVHRRRMEYLRRIVQTYFR